MAYCVDCRLLVLSTRIFVPPLRVLCYPARVAKSIDIAHLHLLASGAKRQSKKKEAEVRKGISTILNNTKQKLKKLKTSNKAAGSLQYPPQVLENARIPVSLRVNTSLICEMYS
ncbi:hypothetical protein OUZ56_032858 [Daphnia magna]|uniref:Uncharacterized protein n=1 Tax=Daphnia magna TaxID=35525 RepID=A0ABR0B9R4_9CRUS|nr:hypothetical protein OUZ56_032858 [Daphnia magna]